jgi:hypothetical protein
MYSAIRPYHGPMRNLLLRRAWWLCAALCACPGDSNDTGDGGTFVTEDSAPTTDAPTGGGLAIGAPCELSTVIGPSVIADPACGGGICVFPDDTPPPQGGCASDEECNAADPSTARFVCNDGFCDLSDSFVAERSTCSETCDIDSDCADVDPSSPCSNGFICAAPGPSPSCCRRMCLCADHVSYAWLNTVDFECEQDMSTMCPL